MPGEDRPACRSVVQLWDDAVAAFLSGQSAVPTALSSWSRAYAGRDAGEVTFDAFPEPYLGSLLADPLGVFLALNPGRADLRFQGRDGRFADEINRFGSYSAWAATWPYLRDPWVAENGRNRHHSSRMTFLRNWHDRSDLSGDHMVGFELYPWHSTAVTGAMRPDPYVIDEYVLQPLRELGSTVFAFGKEWLSLLEHRLGLDAVERLGRGGRPYGSLVPSRAVVIFRDGDLTIVAESHSGSAGPPSRPETEFLRAAVESALQSG